MSLSAALEAIRRAPEGPGVGAFFDFDGTLIDGYSAEALYSHRLRHFEIGLNELVHTVRSMAGPTLTEEQFGELLGRGVAGWSGRPVADIDELGARLFSQSIAGALSHEMWSLVKAHQRQGHTVVIATSATRFQVAPLARELEVDHIVCSELEEEGGLLTGRVVGRPSWGAGKAAAVVTFAEAADIRLVDSFAYANGAEDVPFLACVGRPCAVNAQRELAEYARRHGWPELSLRRGPGRLDPKPALRTAAMYGALAGSGVAGIAVGALTGSRRRGIDLATTLFAHLGSALGDVDVSVIGEANLWARRPAVFLVNHQSSLIDLLVTTTILRGGFTAVAKKEAAAIPVFGRLMAMADFAFIDRADPGQAHRALAEAAQRLADGISIVISPEGTRSLTPRVGQFKKGAFHLAMQAGVPIVPIVIRNAGELMWRNAKTVRSGTVEVVVLDLIPTVGWTKADLDRSVEQVRRLYAETLAHWPESAPSTGSEAQR
ncbi:MULTISPECIES: HAD-IB family hydrolase [Nocardia]|uniref:HAD-IB family hydrolase n=2 Tax=Nocardia TaxID=1817 RepID=A0A2T2ZD11_9NOCA|nr:MULTISPECIES: HAD-IB family hydrolase [Nocardia]MDN2496798.1 HAD-IB family hydrolase [Nocardia nova]PSR65639.1 HAD-IB family hydrolase [Nocardia nova]